MKIKLFIIFIVLFFFSSCIFFEGVLSPCAPPQKKDFKFYNNEFIFDTLCNLNTENVYSAFSE